MLTNKTKILARKGIFYVLLFMYFIFSNDIIPDTSGWIGYLDDVIIAVMIFYFNEINIKTKTTCPTTKRKFDAIEVVIMVVSLVGASLTILSKFQLFTFGEVIESSVKSAPVFTIFLSLMILSLVTILYRRGKSE